MAVGGEQMEDGVGELAEAAEVEVPPAQPAVQVGLRHLPDVLQELAGDEQRGQHLRGDTGRTLSPGEGGQHLGRGGVCCVSLHPHRLPPVGSLLLPVAVLVEQDTQAWFPPALPLVTPPPIGDK